MNSSPHFKIHYEYIIEKLASTWSSKKKMIFTGNHNRRRAQQQQNQNGRRSSNSEVSSIHPSHSILNSFHQNSKFIYFSRVVRDHLVYQEKIHEIHQVEVHIYQQHHHHHHLIIPWLEQVAIQISCQFQKN
jgi:hypothetical protein